MAEKSVKIGIIMLIAWLIPLLSFLLAGTGLIMALIAYAAEKSAMARAGLFLNTLGIMLSAVYTVSGFFLLSSGLLDPLILAP